MRTEHDRCTRRDRLTHKCINEIATLLIEPGMGLVEQPQFRPTSDQTGQRCTATLTGRQTANRHGSQATIQTEPDESLLHIGGVGTGGPPPEPHVVAHSEFVIEPGGMTEQADTMTHGPRVGHEIDAEHDRISPGDGHEAGEGAQQCGLPSTVRPAQQHDSARIDVEVDTGEGRKPTQQGNRPPEMDHGPRWEGGA